MSSAQNRSLPSASTANRYFSTLPRQSRIAAVKLIRRNVFYCAFCQLRGRGSSVVGRRVWGSRLSRGKYRYPCVSLHVAFRSLLHWRNYTPGYRVCPRLLEQWALLHSTALGGNIDCVAQECAVTYLTPMISMSH